MIVLDVNTDTWIFKMSMGTTQDHPTNQFDISIKLSANYPLVLICACTREGEFTYFSQYISSITIDIILFTIY